VALSGSFHATYHRYFEHTSCPPDCTFLWQNDFDYGTVVLDTAGLYCLGEDIKFFPNSEKILLKNGVEPTL
jgi:hypothetical protein